MKAWNDSPTLIAFRNTYEDKNEDEANKCEGKYEINNNQIAYRRFACHLYHSCSLYYFHFLFFSSHFFFFCSKRLRRVHGARVHACTHFHGASVIGTRKVEFFCISLVVLDSVFDYSMVGEIANGSYPACSNNYDAPSKAGCRYKTRQKKKITKEQVQWTDACWLPYSLFSITWFVFGHHRPQLLAPKDNQFEYDLIRLFQYDHKIDSIHMQYEWVE